MSTTETDHSFMPFQKSVEVNWSNLPPELLQTISKKLHDICDFIYFRCVCKSWYTGTSISDLPPQIPWMFSDVDKNNGRMCFYSIFSAKIRTIHCPLPSLTGICGPARGYLYTYQYIPGQNMRHALLNPLTINEVALEFMEGLHGYSIISMSPTLTGDDDYMVSVNENAMRMEFYQPHKPKQFFSRGPSCSLQDTPGGGGCLKGMYFQHQVMTCETKVYNIVGRYSFVIPPPQMHSYDDKVFFVELEGKVLRIVKHWKDCGYIFDIYQLDVEDEIHHRYRWVKIGGINNYALFLDHVWLVSGIFIEATESTGLRGNCIYHIERYNDKARLDYGIYRYDINDGRSQRIPCPYKKFRTWYVPSLVSLLPSA